RGPLTWPGGELPPRPPAPFPPPPPAATVQALVPGVHVVDKPPGGVLRKLVRASLSGRTDSAELKVSDELGAFVVRYPATPGLWVEQVARVVDVAAGMRRRFGPTIAHVKLISID